MSVATFAANELDPARAVARLAEMGTEPAGSTPEELARQIINDVKTWGKVVKEAGIRAN